MYGRELRTVTDEAKRMLMVNDRPGLVYKRKRVVAEDVEEIMTAPALDQAILR